MTEFIGFPRPDGSVGIRNHVLLLGLDPAGLGVCCKVAGLLKETLPVFSRTEDTSVLSDIVRHPNVAGSVVVGECLDEQHVGGLVPDLQKVGKPHQMTEVGGLDSIAAISRTTQTAIGIMRDVSTQRRVLVRCSKLLPVLIHVPAEMMREQLFGFVKLIMEENGRCIWVEKETNGQVEIDPKIGKNLAGELKLGQAPGRDPGLYRYAGPENYHAIFKAILASGAQITAIAVEAKRFRANPLIPGVRFLFGEGDNPSENCDMNLSQVEDRKLSTQEAGLLLFSEILATSSGKLTRDEMLQDALVT
jgi:altronate dehydratase